MGKGKAAGFSLMCYLRTLMIHGARAALGKAREWVAYHEVEWQNEVRQRALRAVSLLLLGLRSKKSAPSVIIRTELISQLA
jgi:hypothetical protein